ncbi:DUF58 domain-containing protein [Steroidobacter sp.]|uniref:DUF58 domain-containing protein n=1 Tax=Steroidobacter sp. TaxID=1978227 RepID=UPI001A519968|nr:hypothetical protein [Steroidobacter sp.]MBL8265247.1 hypothetical protein [Steroidobacter sp.]
MTTSREFHYRLPHRSGGWRPGSHPGSSLGAGQEFVSHVKLYDRPDPRRLDLRASLREVRGDWLVRTHRQRVSVPVHVIADVSSSMSFGSPKSKLQVAADFVTALGHSAFRVGDALGMLAFDAHERRDLFVPALLSRGVGEVMASLLAECEGTAGSSDGLEEAATHLAGRHGLIFIASDFHWRLDRLGDVLDMLAHSYIVPLVIWDPAETQPPQRDGLLPLRDVESNRRSTVWLRPSMRTRWHEAVERRRGELNSLFAARGIRPFYVSGAFDGEALSHYFFEATA